VSQCPNCGSSSGSRYCPECGEPQGPLVPSLFSWLRESFDDLFLVNGSVPRTLLCLLGRPGHLTREWLVGHRTRYLRPLRVYLLAAIPLFFAWSLNPGQHSMFGELAAGFAAGANNDTGVVIDDPRDDQLMEQLNKRIDILVPLVSVPVFTLAAMAAVPALRVIPVAALIFSLHMHGLYMLVAAGVLGLATVMGPLPWWFEMVYLAAAAGYTGIALRRAFGTSIAGAVLRTAALSVLTVLGLVAVVAIAYGVVISG
jgi:hypothetical protein